MTNSATLYGLLSRLPSPSGQILIGLVKEHTFLDSDQGLLAPCGVTGQPLLLLILETFGQKITQSERESCNTVMQQLFEAAPDSKLITRPRWQDAPINAWLFALLALPAGLTVAPFVHPNMLHLARNCWQKTPNLVKLRSAVQGAASPLLSLTRPLNPSQVIELSQCQTHESMLAFYMARLAYKFSYGSPRYKEYRAKLQRLFGNVQPKYTGSRKVGPYGPRPESYTDKFSAYPGTDPDAYEDFPQEHPTRQAFKREAIRYEKELVSTQHQIKRKHHFAEPFPGSQFTNPTPDTPGVPSLVEIGILLNGCSSLPPQRAARACLLLLAAVGAGWTRQIQTCKIANRSPAIDEHPGLVILPDRTVSLQPRSTVGRPVWYQDDPSRRTQFTQTHSPSLRDYCLKLHPALTACIEDSARYAQNGLLYSRRNFQQAVEDLNSLLQSACPDAPKITPGRLSLLFQGLANQWNLPWAPRYAICARPMAIHEMAINYTLVSLTDTTQAHWDFVNRLLEHLWQVSSTNSARLGAIQIPKVLKPTDQSSPSTPGHTGSWSTPNLTLIREVITFTQTQQARTDLPSYENHNWMMRLAGFSGTILMAMRPYAIENLKLTARQPLSGTSFAQRVKRRHGEPESWIERYVPSVIRSLWWQAMRKSADVPHQGGLPCLLDSNGAPRSFSVQQELYYVLAKIGYIAENIRAYGLRHLGRTLLANAGLSDTDLALVMNHWGKGFERHNMIRLGSDLTDFPRKFDLAADIAAKQIGLNPSHWNLSTGKKRSKS